jgi:hypothetical protein
MHACIKRAFIGEVLPKIPLLPHKTRLAFGRNRLCLDRVARIRIRPCRCSCVIRKMVMCALCWEQIIDLEWALQCLGCFGWLHEDCHGLSHLQVMMLPVVAIPDEDVIILFTCDQCIENAEALPVPPDN